MKQFTAVVVDALATRSHTILFDMVNKLIQKCQTRTNKNSDNKKDNITKLSLQNKKKKYNPFHICV